MSRIGKKPIDIPSGIGVELKGRHLKVTGPLGTLEMDCHPLIGIRVDEGEKKIAVENDKPEVRQNRQLHGTMRALVANIVQGVSRGFEKKMEIYGTGYNIKEQGDELVFQIGFCHPAVVAVPKGIKVSIEVPATRGNDVPARFTVSGTDKHLLGQFSADIRRLRAPEPYKGKGIRYADEHVRRKAGKSFTSGTV